MIFYLQFFKKKEPIILVDIKIKKEVIEYERIKTICAV